MNSADSATMFDPPLSDRELWKFAILIEMHFGDEAPGFITDRMTTLAKNGDQPGVAIWEAIADRYDQLQGETTARHWLPT